MQQQHKAKQSTSVFVEGRKLISLPQELPKVLTSGMLWNPCYAKLFERELGYVNQPTYNILVVKTHLISSRLNILIFPYRAGQVEEDSCRSSWQTCINGR